MEIFINERPWAPAAALTQVTAVRVVPAAGISLIAQADQVQVQAELTLAPTSAQVNETSGFTGAYLRNSKRGMDVRGVPPRGRPV